MSHDVDAAYRKAGVDALHASDTDRVHAIVGQHQGPKAFAYAQSIAARLPDSGIIGW
jgi:hypothetical protein